LIQKYKCAPPGARQQIQILTYTAGNHGCRGRQKHCI